MKYIPSGDVFSLLKTDRRIVVIVSKGHWGNEFSMVVGLACVAGGCLRFFADNRRPPATQAMVG